MIRETEGSNEIERTILLAKIEIMRKKLVSIGLQKGLNAYATIQYSEELDKQIDRYQKLHITGKK